MQSEKHGNSEFLHYEKSKHKPFPGSELSLKLEVNKNQCTFQKCSTFCGKPHHPMCLG